VAGEGDTQQGAKICVRRPADTNASPSEMAKYVEAIKENAANAVKEPSCREFNVLVMPDRPNHVFLYEVYDNEAALAAHRNTEHFKKYAATTANMVSTRPRSAPGDLMTLGNMRANGVRSLDVSCWQCHHRTITSADPSPDHVPVPSFGPRMVCTSLVNWGQEVLIIEA
jgi:autoinducer 2-degrading protein